MLQNLILTDLGVRMCVVVLKYVCKFLTLLSPKVESNSLSLDYEPVFEVRSDLLLIIIIIAVILCGY